MKKISTVNAAADYKITLCFDNDEILMFDMKGKLHTARFSDLKDLNRFYAVKTDGRSIFWPGGVSISISELMELSAIADA